MKKKKLDKLSALQQPDTILTSSKFYFEQKKKHPEACIIMRYYDAYYILGDDADNYSYPKFSFGCHNLDKVLPELIRAGLRVAISDYDIAFKEWGGWECANRITREAEEKRKREEVKKPKWVEQLIPFDWN